MESYYKFLSLVFATITSAVCLPAHSAYQYTYTSEPLEFIQNNIVRGDVAPINQDDLFKITINSSKLLTPTIDLLSQGSITFELGSYTLYSTRTEVMSHESNFSLFEIREFDSSNLPTQWTFQTSQYLYRSENDGSSMGFGSGPLYNTFFARGMSEMTQYNLVASTGGAGTWTLSEITSPVPEPETYAMLLAGLGLIGFVSRRKKH